MEFATLCSGGECFGVGARQAGLDHCFGVEINPKIAAIARANGFNVDCADVNLYVPPRSAVDIFLVHDSPPCQSASNANPMTSEEVADVRLAQSSMNFVTKLMPQFFTLENVVGYQRFKAFKYITQTLLRLGYSFAYWNINLADFGVPQTRRRLILIARRDGKRVQGMSATHKRYPDLFAKRWVSWSEALKDEIQNLKPSSLSNKQKKKMEGNIKLKTSHPVLVDTRNGGQRRYTFRSWDEPCYTVTATATKGHGKIRHRGNWFKMSEKAYSLIQTLPSDYKLTGNVATNQRVIGNGVPPLFSKQLCQHLMRIK